VVGIITDITESKKAIEKEVLYKNQLVQADKLVSLGLLVSGIVHEINNPNNFISLSTPLLRKAWDCIVPVLERHTNETKDLQIGSIAFQEFVGNIDKLLCGIEEGSRRITRIVSDLKDYSRFDTQNLKCLIDLNAVVKSALTLMEPMTKKSTKNLKSIMHEAPLIIEGNYQRLEQVLINLIHNACDALRSCDESITITTNPGKNKDVVITVKDEGCGICKSDLDKLVEPFFTTKREKGGTGLGLSVSAGIVKDHNGKMLFESEPGKGTTVTLIFNTGKCK